MRVSCGSSEYCGPYFTRHRISPFTWLLLAPRYCVQNAAQSCVLTRYSFWSRIWRRHSTSEAEALPATVLNACRRPGQVPGSKSPEDSTPGSGCVTNSVLILSFLED